MKQISLTTKTIIISAACVILLELFVVFISMSYINNLKNNLVSDALTLAEAQGKNIAESISSQEDMSLLSKYKDKRKINDYVKILLKENDAITHIVIIDEEGNVYTESTKGNAGLEITLSQKNPHSHNISIPIEKDKESLGKINFSISRESVEKKGKQISKQIIVLIVIITVMTFIAFLLLVKVFQHYIEIMKRTEQMDRMSYIGTLAAGLVHEIRNPLNAMNVNFELVKEESENPSENTVENTKKLVDRLQSQIVSLNKLLTNFMSFAIPSVSEKMAFNIVELIDESVEFFTPQFTKQRIQFLKEYKTDEPILIDADQNEIRQVLMNIIINAIQSLDKDMKLIIFNIDRSGNDKVILSIKDNGCGIDKHKMGKIFNIFYTTKPGGGGFGLAIAKRIVSSFGGEIWAESEVGDGTVFFIEFPIVKK